MQQVAHWKSISYIHYYNLKLYSEFGFVITENHLAVCSCQGTWLTSYMEIPIEE